MEEIFYILYGGQEIHKFSKLTGVGEPALRLLLGLLFGYLFAIFYRFLLPNIYTVKHLFSILSGLWLSYFCFKFDCIHSFLSIFLTWLTLAIIPNRKISLTIAFVGNFGHDIDFTTTQSVLTLRLIGTAWDYYDGGKADKELEHDQKMNRLKELPSIIELLSYCYFFGGFLIGPQYPFRLYRQFYTKELYTDAKGEKRLPSALLPTLRCFLLGVVYLGFHNIFAGTFPSSYFTTNEFLHQISFGKRLIVMWIVCKVAMSKYMGVWLIGECPCTLVGLNFAGHNADGTHKGWRALSNVNPYQFETTLNLQGVVESFNVNTNDWVKRYIFKRLKWVGDRNVSALSALFFLAIWHGFHVGYYLCFFLEYLDMEVEKKLKRITDPLTKMLDKGEMAPLRYTFYAICYATRSFAIHYGLTSFEMKSWSRSIDVYLSLYFIGHLAIVTVFLLDENKPKKKTTKKE